MRDAWFRSLIRTFPQPYRADYQDQLAEALDEAPSGTSSVIRESLALIWASSVSWRRHLKTPGGLRSSAFFGAMLWLGFLMAVGPIARLRLSVLGQVPEGMSVPPAYSIAAAALLVAAIVALRASRILALMIGLGAVVAGALALRVGEWQLVPALGYELRWIGLALAACAALRPQRASWMPLLGGLAAGSVSFLFATKSIYLLRTASGEEKLVDEPWWAWALSRNYAFGIRGHLSGPLSDFASRGVWEWVSFFVVVALLIAMITIPAVAVLMIPAAVHLGLMSPITAWWPPFVLLAIAGWRLVWDRVDVNISWRSPVT